MDQGMEPARQQPARKQSNQQVWIVVVRLDTCRMIDTMCTNVALACGRLSKPEVPPNLPRGCHIRKLFSGDEAREQCESLPLTPLPSLGSVLALRGLPGVAERSCCWAWA